MTVAGNPFLAPPPAEVPLRHAPLVRVIAQLRFPEVLSVERREFVAPFQEAIRSAYPVLRQEQTQGFLLSPAGVASATPQSAWRFADTDGHWRVSLTPDFLALETTKYASRSDFLKRLSTVTAALNEHIAPAQIDRLGVRYIDRITGAAVDDIAKLVRAEVRGIAGTIAATHAAHAMSESLFELDDDRLLARWGCLPPNVTLDLAAIEPAAEKSWILDLDMFSASAMSVDAEQIADRARRYTERIYTLFRWAVTDEFLARFGGKS